MHCTADIAAGFSGKKPSHWTVHVALFLKAALGNVNLDELHDRVLSTNLLAQYVTGSTTM